MEKRKETERNLLLNESGNVTINDGYGLDPVVEEERGTTVLYFI